VPSKDVITSPSGGPHWGPFRIQELHLIGDLQGGWHRPGGPGGSKADEASRRPGSTASTDYRPIAKPGTPPFVRDRRRATEGRRGGGPRCRRRYSPSGPRSRAGISSVMKDIPGFPAPGRACPARHRRLPVEGGTPFARKTRAVGVARAPPKGNYRRTARPRGRRCHVVPGSACRNAHCHGPGARGAGFESRKGSLRGLLLCLSLPCRLYGEKESKHQRRKTIPRNPGGLLRFLPPLSALCSMALCLKRAETE